MKFIDVIHAKWQRRRFADWIGPKPVTELYDLCLLRVSTRNRNDRSTYRWYISIITCVLDFALFSLFSFVYFFCFCFIRKLNYLCIVDGNLIKENTRGNKFVRLVRVASFSFIRFTLVRTYVCTYGSGVFYDFIRINNKLPRVNRIPMRVKYVYECIYWSRLLWKWRKSILHFITWYLTVRPFDRYEKYSRLAGAPPIVQMGIFNVYDV